MARKHRITKIHVFDIVRDKVDVPIELLINNVHDSISTQREFPVASHHVDAQQLAGLDHVLPLCPERRSGALPQVTAVQEQCAWSVSAQPFNQGRNVGEASRATELLRRRNIVKMSQRMRRL